MKIAAFPFIQYLTLNAFQFPIWQLIHLVQNHEFILKLCTLCSRPFCVCSHDSYSFKVNQYSEEREKRMKGALSENNGEKFIFWSNIYFTYTLVVVGRWKKLLKFTERTQTMLWFSFILLTNLFLLLCLLKKLKLNSILEKINFDQQISWNC
jgi:hypothetical protein